MSNIVTAVILLIASMVALATAQNRNTSQLISSGKYAFASSSTNGLTANKVLDGSLITTSCTGAAAYNYITVALVGVFRIASVRFWIPEHVTTGPPTIKVQRRLQNGEWLDCGSELPSASVQGRMNEVSCGNEMGTFVRIYQPSNGGYYLCMSEIEVYGVPSAKGKQLISRGKPAHQSSTNSNSKMFEASTAVDGGIFDGRYTHTNAENRPWWRVNFLGFYNVYTVRIYAGSNAHLTPLTVDTHDDQGVWSSCGTISDPTVAGGVYEINCRAVMANSLRVQALNNGVHLIISEVEVFGEEAELEYSWRRALH